MADIQTSPRTSRYIIIPSLRSFDSSRLIVELHRADCLVGSHGADYLVGSHHQKARSRSSITDRYKLDLEYKKAGANQMGGIGKK